MVISSRRQIFFSQVPCTTAEEEAQRGRGLLICFDAATTATLFVSLQGSEKLKSSNI